MGKIPAFPSTTPTPSGDGTVFRDGMTLRDYFAGQALVGFAANPTKMPGTTDVPADVLARAAYIIADAMIAERETER